ncbi:hypothetical protein LY90DRAFT_508890 [Neocallimastix californiae]|uniref:Uncharacterized protein n=1 Tax=Neocallimastix californiae TaxID=1754190 RepID=A0A1Y2CN72_9FUNG|nr:hypothetical protein LY90DRAFT_508890 [Neocallimastix californiae]|eukprot:ORY48386.1 hypothetical protein LY90DRAFT_508890 [Neocallimastix californiae]
MVKVHFNQNIQTVETYDAGDYDRTSVPIAELNDEEFNEIECYRLEMKKQTIEEYQKRWRKTRNSNSSSLSESTNNSDSESDNSIPPLKSCLINKSSNASNKLNNKLNTSALNAAMSVSISSSLEDDASFFGEGQAQPNIITPYSSEYNSDEGHIPKVNVELSSSLESNMEAQPKEHFQLFTELENEDTDYKEIKEFDDRNHLTVISPLSFESNDISASDNDADAEESAEDNSFIRLFEDSFEKSTEEGDSDYIKDMSLTEGENSITLSHYMLSDDIPTTSFHSSKHRLFTDSIFNSSPILSESVLEDKEFKSSQLQEETPNESQEEEEEEKEKEDSKKEEDGDEEEELNDLEEVLEPEHEDDSSDDEIDNHPHSDTLVNYGSTQHINIKPKRNNIYDEFTGTSSCPFGKPISFLDDLPDIIQSPLSSSLSSSSAGKKESFKNSTNFFGSPFSQLKSPYRSSSYSSLQTNRLNRYGSSSRRRLSHFTTSKWEGIGSRSSNNNNINKSSNNISTTSRYYPRPATKLVTNSPFSSSWSYDASF